MYAAWPSAGAAGPSCVARPSHNDRNVALVVSHPSLPATTINDPVETGQVAPTIFRSLGINPNELQDARTENSKELNLT